MYSYKETNIVAKSMDPCVNLTSACSQIQIVWLGYGMADGKIVVRIPVVMTTFFIFPKAPKPVMRPSHPSLQRVPGALYPSRSGLGLKFAKCESSAEVKSYVELYRHSSIFLCPDAYLSAGNTDFWTLNQQVVTIRFLLYVILFYF